MADSGSAALDAMIAKLKKLGASDVGARVATKAAPLVDEAIKRTAKAGQTPDGQTWQQKKNGERPLVNAAASITTRPAGNLVISTLTGPTVIHHLGLGGFPKRQVLPETGTIPPAVSTALETAAREVIAEVLGGS